MTLIAPPARAASGQDVLATIPQDVSGIAAYYAAEDNAQHVIAAGVDGSIYEIYFHARQGVHLDVLAKFPPGLYLVAGYYAAEDNAQHVIVAGQDGVVHELYFHAGQGVHDAVLAKFPDPIYSIAAYYAAQDNAQHVIVNTFDQASRSAIVHEIYFHAAQGVHQDVLATLPGVSPFSVAGYYSAEDDYQHVLVANVGASTSQITNIFFRAAQGVHQSVLATFVDPNDPLWDVAGYYAPNERYQHVPYLTASGVRDLVFRGSGPIVSRNVAPRSRYADVLVGVAGYYAAEDGNQHIIVVEFTVDSAGRGFNTLHEIYFRDRNDEPNY
jgi:hypothetical protein